MENTNTENIKDKDYYKMKFIFNAIEQGWSVKKKDNFYIFKTKHNNKEEVFNEDYLEEFVMKNMKLNGK
jgi:hypothetical protein